VEQMKLFFLLFGYAYGEYVFMAYGDAGCVTFAEEKHIELSECFKATDELYLTITSPATDSFKMAINEESCTGEKLDDGSLTCALDECCTISVEHDGHTDQLSYKIESEDDHDHTETKSPPPSPPPSASSDKPCFSKDSTHAFFASGERVLMSELRSGDVVKDGPDSVSRVIVNQHRAVEKMASLLNLEHTKGTLSLTPDHALFVDGKIAAAVEAVPGSKLGDASVVRTTSSTGAVINPITASGKILAAGEGEAVLAASTPNWIAEYLLTSYVPLPVSLSNAISFAFPESTQAYYDAVLEDFFGATAPSLMKLKTALPSPLVAAAFLISDLAVSAGFIGFSLASPKAVLAVVAVFAAKMARK